MGAMWFCSALLLVSFLSFGMMIVSKGHSQWIQHLIFACSMILGAVCCYLHVKSPYCLWQNIQICMIFYMGYLFRRYEYVITGSLSKYTVLLISLAVLTYSTLNGYYAHLQPENVSTENPIILLVLALFGCLGIYSLSSLLKCSIAGNFLAIIGNSSFSIMALHFLAFKAVILLQCLFYGMNLTNLSSFPCLNTKGVWCLLYLVTGVTLPVAASIMYHRIIKLNRNLMLYYEK